MLILGVVAAAWLSGRVPHALRGRPAVLVRSALLGGLMAGTLLGSAAGRRAGNSCAADLKSGEGILVQGVARESAVPGGSSRLTLTGVKVRETGESRGCFVPRLVVRVDTVESLIPAGAPVAIRGEWVRIGRPSAWPRRPGRLGIVVGRVGMPEEEMAGPSVFGAHRPGRALRAARARASDRLRRLLPPDVSPVARALVLAERDDLPGALRTRFAEAGLAHLLAISGLHVGLIGAAINLLLRSFAGPSRAAVGAATVVAAYVMAIGAPPSAVRASLLMAGWALARVRGLPGRPWDLLGAAAILALVTDPMVLLDPGFQLSFAGFSGLGAGAALWNDRVVGPMARRPTARGLFRRLPRAARRQASLAGLAMASGTGAFAATAPIAAAHFQHLAPSALLSHFAGTPLVGGAIGSLAMALFLPPPLDALGAAAAASIIRLMMTLADRVAGLPGAHAAISEPSGITWVVLVLVLAGLWRWLRWGRFRSSVLPFAAAAALVLASPALHSRVPGGFSLICTLDVGQGDAAVLRTSRGRWILFDAGPNFGRRDAGRDVVLPMLRRYGARRIDLFVLSHPDLDHLGGFESIHETVPVFRVLDSGHPIPKPSYERFLARTEDDGIRWLPARVGDAYSLDNVTIRVLGPAESRPENEGNRDANETSLLLRVSIGTALVYLNTGDATAEAERALLSGWVPDSLRADLLKVGHHGSRSSTASDFLSAVSPATAVISAGRGNAYGHPHKSVLNRLSNAGISRVWRTDRDGTLCVEVDEERGWRVQGERGWTRRTESGTRLDVTKG